MLVLEHWCWSDGAGAMELEHWRRWRWSTGARAKELQGKTLPNPCASDTFQEDLVRVAMQDVVDHVCLNI